VLPISKAFARNCPSIRCTSRATSGNAACFCFCPTSGIYPTVTIQNCT
jgi:hypothetical protein